MLRKNPVFSQGSERERNFRMCICLIGFVIVLYTAATLFSILISLDEIRDYFVRSAFMVKNLPEKIYRLVK